MIDKKKLVLKVLSKGLEVQIDETMIDQYLVEISNIDSLSAWVIGMELRKFFIYKIEDLFENFNNLNHIKISDILHFFEGLPTQAETMDL